MNVICLKCLSSERFWLGFHSQFTAEQIEIEIMWAVDGRSFNFGCVCCRSNHYLRGLSLEKFPWYAWICYTATNMIKRQQLPRCMNRIIFLLFCFSLFFCLVFTRTLCNSMSSFSIFIWYALRKVHMFFFWFIRFSLV